MKKFIGSVALAGVLVLSLSSFTSLEKEKQQEQKTAKVTDCFTGSFNLMVLCKENGMSALEALDVYTIMYDACKAGVISYN